MGPSWAHAFVAAGLLTLAGTPVLRRVALATGFVDHPVAAHKSHDKSTPYLGGVGLVVAVLVAMLFTSHLTAEAGAVALGGSLIGCLGLLDDHRSVGALFRFGVEVGVAALALSVGLRVHATDIPAIDGLITIIWIVGITNAVNLLDNMDGLAGGVSAAAAAAIFAIAVLGEQAVSATLAAGLAGACLGFLAHNKRPASIFMGDAGSLFLGFTLSILAIGVSPALRPPASFAIPLMLLALPVLDTATVTISRLRRRRSVAQGGKDHLSHRLVARGLSPGAAVMVLVAIEGAVGGLAVSASREVVPLIAAIASAAALLALLTLGTVRADVYAEPLVGLPRRLKLAGLIGIAVFLMMAAPAVVALARAHGPGIAGAVATRQGLAALAAGDTGRATTAFNDASADLHRSEVILNGRANSLGLAIPVLRANLATARAVVRAGLEVTGAGSDLSSVVDAANLPLRDGADPAGGGLPAALKASSDALGRASSELAGYDRPYLWPALGGSVRQLRTSLASASDNAMRAADLVRLVPAMLGTAGPRRYFVAVEDNAELRGGGGVIHLWAELQADGGRLSLTRFGTVDDLNAAVANGSPHLPAELLARYRQFDVAGTWQNVNVSPDFPVTGQAIAAMYPESGGAPVDGVLAVDLPGLAALLDLAGPVTVPGRTESLTAANLVDVIVRESYVRFPVPADRDAFVADAVGATLRALASADPGTPAHVARVLAPAAALGHLLLYPVRPEEEGVARSLGMDGAIPAGSGDSLMVVNQNLSASGIDAYLHRQVRYDALLDPSGGSATITGHVAVTLRNDAPSSGLPVQVIGPADDRFTPGENRTYLSVYSPLSLMRSTLEGQPATVSADAELGREAYSLIVSVPSAESRTVGMDLRGRVALGTDDWYHLDLLHQASLAPDDAAITISVPEGWRIVEARGLHIDDDRHASADRQLTDASDVAVRLQRTPWDRLWRDG